jgi:hypothetical protein
VRGEVDIGQIATDAIRISADARMARPARCRAYMIRSLTPGKTYTCNPIQCVLSPLIISGENIEFEEKGEPLDDTPIEVNPQRYRGPVATKRPSSTVRAGRRPPASLDGRLVLGPTRHDRSLALSPNFNKLDLSDATAPLNRDTPPNGWGRFASICG